jgi:deoxyribonuclease-1
MTRGLISLLLVLCVSVSAHAEITDFREAKRVLREQVYHDQHHGKDGTLYCGCDWRWVGESGGRVDFASCGFQVRAQETRARRTEWEHVVPAWVMGHQRQCWQNGGRKNCRSTDPMFGVMEADLHNLVPSVGELNADRSNYRFGVLPDAPLQHGQCDFEVDFKQRVVEPRDEVKGQIARIYFYVHDRYNLQMSRQQQQLMMAWNQSYPVATWERERDARIARIVGHNNPFVTGERAWTLGHKNHADGLISKLDPDGTTSIRSAPAADSEIRGNRNSNVYHLPSGCPSYDRVSPRNIVKFTTEAEAKAAGFRKAGNCR